MHLQSYECSSAPQPSAVSSTAFLSVAVSPVAAMSSANEHSTQHSPAADVRVAMFENGLLWHLLALGHLWVYALAVVQLSQRATIGPVVQLGAIPLLASLRVRAASMRDQRKALHRAGRAWLWGWVAMFFASVLDSDGSKQLVHRVLRDSWLLGFAALFTVAKATGDALFADPASPESNLARMLYRTALVLKSAASNSVECALFWLGHAVVLEGVYALVNEYVASRERLMVLGLRLEQIEGEKDRLDFERRLQRKWLQGTDDPSDHGLNTIGGVLGAMQDPEITAKQVSLASPIDNTAQSPDSVTAPLFAVGETPDFVTLGWESHEHTPEAHLNSSVDSSVVQSIEAAQKRAEPTWAPPPPSIDTNDRLRLPLFRRRSSDPGVAALSSAARSASVC